jgi:homoserine dehydrogenase
VVADIVDVTRSLTTDSDNRVPHLAFQPDQLNDIPILSMDDVETAYYLRLQALDKPGVMADIARIMGENNISMEAILQKEPAANESTATIIMLTQCIQESQMNLAISAIQELSSVSGEVTRIRVENLD